MAKVDIAVIGAGPAGAAAARRACALGLTVALIDKATFPRNKLCGGLVTGRCAGQLKDVFGLDIDPQLFDTRRNFEFHMQGKPLGGLEDVPPLHLTMRWDFDLLLCHEAVQAGALDYTGQRIGHLELQANRIALQSGEQIDYTALIGADGVQSIVAKALFGRSFDPARVGFALEVEAPSEGPDPTTPIRIDFGAARWGYGWSFPKRGSTTIGLGGLHAPNPDMAAHLAAYLDQLGTGQGIRVKGHFLPFGEAKPRPGRGNVLLAGDAAGLVDPITGEGIGHAIASGRMAAEAAARALREGQPGLATRYHRAATRPIRVAIGQARMLRPLIFAPRLQPFFARTFTASRSLKRDYMRLLSGETEYPALLAQVAARLPRAAWRHIRSRRRRHR